MLSCEGDKMKIAVNDLLKNNLSQKEINLQEEIGETKLNGDNIKFVEPVILKGILTNNEGIIRLKGVIEIKLGLNCHRCSKSFTYQDSIDIDECYTSAEKVKEDFYGFSGSEIDLSSMIYDNIFTNIPMKILCNNECKGLCGVCGCNKNENDCDCIDKQYDPRLEALLKLKNNL